MKSRKPIRDELCAEPDPDDGIPPHELEKRGRPRSSRNAGRHRLAQLCKQVHIALSESLLCDCCDPVVQSLEVESVQPMTGSTVLLVTLRARTGDSAEIDHAHRQLGLESGTLRAAVASAIHRKRVPQLRFCIVA